MTIKKKIESDETKRNSFISKGGGVYEDKKKFRNILIRIPADFLESLDNHLEKQPWVSRTSWVMQAIKEKLMRDEQEDKNTQTYKMD